jgi:hypothetical protein
MAPNAPNIIPIEPTFENPHRAYVAITVDLSCRRSRRFIKVHIQVYTLYRIPIKFRFVPFKLNTGCFKGFNQKLK